MLHVLLAVMVSLAGAGEGDDAAPVPAAEPATTTSTGPSSEPESSTSPTPPTNAAAPTPLLPPLPWTVPAEVPAFHAPDFEETVKSALRAEADRDGFKARQRWCQATRLASGANDVSLLARFAEDRCLQWTRAIGIDRDPVAATLLPAMLAHLQSDASVDEKVAGLEHFASMVASDDPAGIWAKTNVARLRRGDPPHLDTADADADAVADDRCPEWPEDEDGDEDDDGCPEDEGTCCVVESDPWWWKAMKVPATPDVGLGLTGAWSLGGVVDGDRPRASVVAPSLTFALPWVEVGLLLPAVVGLAAGAGVGSTVTLTPIELDPLFLSPNTFSWIAPTVGADVFAGDDDVRFGVTVGNSVTLARTVVVRPFYRYDVFAPAGTSPHGLGVVVRVNVLHALEEVDW